jgi:hypothetical protein
MTSVLFQYRSGIRCRRCGQDSYVPDAEIQRIVAAPPMRAALTSMVVLIFLLAVLGVRGLRVEATILVGILCVHIVRQWSLNSATTSRTQDEAQARKAKTGKWFTLLAIPVVVAIAIQEVRPFLPPEFAMAPIIIGGLLLVWFFRANRAFGRVNR